MLHSMFELFTTFDWKINIGYLNSTTLIWTDPNIPTWIFYALNRWSLNVLMFWILYKLWYILYAYTHKIPIRRTYTCVCHHDGKTGSLIDMWLECSPIISLYTHNTNPRRTAVLYQNVCILFCCCWHIRCLPIDVYLYRI